MLRSTPSAAIKANNLFGVMPYCPPQVTWGSTIDHSAAAGRPLFSRLVGGAGLQQSDVIISNV